MLMGGSTLWRLIMGGWIDYAERGIKALEAIAKHAENLAHPPVVVEPTDSFELPVAALYAIAKRYNVDFYDDVEPSLYAPVYCNLEYAPDKMCLGRSQSLKDRLLKKPSECEACVDHLKWG